MTVVKTFILYSIKFQFFMAVFPKDRSADHVWSTKTIYGPQTFSIWSMRIFFEQKTCRILAKICFMLKTLALNGPQEKLLVRG